MIVLKNVSFAYKPDTWTGKPVDVLLAANLVIPTRSQVAILGGAGAGKSTLLRLMCGMLPPSRGIVKRAGSVSFPVGFIGASGRNSVSQYIQFVAKCYAVDAKSFLHYVIEFAELEDVLHRPMGKLEPDRRGRLNMTIGYALPFDHYLFDSRIAASDPSFRKKCMRFLELRQQTAGIVLATRRASVAREFCTSAVVLHDASLTYFEDIDRAIDYFDEVEPNPTPRTSDAYYSPSDAFAFEVSSGEEG